MALVIGVYACDFDCNSSHWHATNGIYTNGEPLTRNIHEYPIRDNDVVLNVVDVALVIFVALFGGKFAYRFFEI